MRVPFLPPPGIIADDTTFSAEGRYADGSNVRFWNARPQTIGGWSTYVRTALTGVCRSMLSWLDTAGQRNTVAFGTHSKLQVFAGGGLYDITPTGLAAGLVDSAGGAGYGAGTYSRDGYGDAASTGYYLRTWSLANWGNYLLANPIGGGLYYWAGNTANRATVVSTGPTQINSILVTPERQVLAFGCNEEVSGTFNSMCIRGSDLEDYSDWTTTAVNNAFEHILPGSGRIVSARMIGSYVAVWTDSGVYLGQFIGDPGQTYRFDLVATNCGLIGQNAVTVVNQVAYWVTPDCQFYAWSVGTPPKPIPCTVRTDFRDNLVRAQADKIICTGIGAFSEVWWFYPDGRDGIENSRYVAVSTADGTWFRGQMERTAAIDSGAVPFPLMATQDGNVYAHESGQTADGSPLSWFLETADQYLGQDENWLMVRGIWPDFKDQQGPINVTVNVRPYAQATATTRGPYALSPGMQRRDFLASGRVASVRFEGSSSPAYVRFGKPTFDVVATGQQ